MAVYRPYSGRKVALCRPYTGRIVTANDLPISLWAARQLHFVFLSNLRELTYCDIKLLEMNLKFERPSSENHNYCTLRS